MRNAQFYALAIFLMDRLDTKGVGQEGCGQPASFLLGLSASLMTHRYLESGGLPMIFFTSIASVVAL